MLATSHKSSDEIYFEVQIDNSCGSLRAGFATRECELSGPIGMDKHGYSYGSKNGYGFHNSVRVTFGERMNSKDVLSAFLHRIDGVRVLEFFINGCKVPGLFTGLSDNDYYPAVSLYGGCTVTTNFGPYFAYETKIIDGMSLKGNEIEHHL